MIPDVAESALSEAYDRLAADIRAKGYGSIWEYAFNVKNNTRYTTLYSAAISLPSDISSELETVGFMRPSKDDGEYVITAKGIRHVEEVRGIDTLSLLIEEIDGRYFEIEVKKVSPREKIVLFSMVMVRSFSETCCVDARKDDSVKDRWMEIFIRAQEELKRVGAIDDRTSIEDLGKASDTEKPMSNIIRHTDGLDAKVKMLYRKTGRNQYYLDLANESGSIDVEKLAFILGIIFEGEIAYDRMGELVDFCNESSRMDSVFVYDVGDDEFSGSDHDDEIEEAFRMVYRSNLHVSRLSKSDGFNRLNGNQRVYSKGNT